MTHYALSVDGNSMVCAKEIRYVLTIDDVVWRICDNRNNKNHRRALSLLNCKYFMYPENELELTYYELRATCQKLYKAYEDVAQMKIIDDRFIAFGDDLYQLLMLMVTHEIELR
jgi:hypothetical protein